MNWVLREFSRGSTAVNVRLMEAMTTTLQFTHNERDRAAVIRHAQMVYNLGKETIQEPHDFDDLSKRAEGILSE